MSLKTYLRTAWNEPRRFFFFLTLLCGLCLAVFFVTTYEPRFGPTASMPTILIAAVGLWVLGIVIGVFGFMISWIPPVYRLLTWLLRRRFFLLACVITLVALFYAEENWRGHHAWQKYKGELEARGETVDFAKLAPPPVPDEQNFAMAPIIVESISAHFSGSGNATTARAKIWYGNKVAALGHTNLTNYLEMPVELTGPGLYFTNGSGDWRHAQKTNLEEWQNYYRHLATVTNFFPVSGLEQTPAQDVLLALSKYDLNIEGLRSASERPFSRFPVTYTNENPAGILLTHLAIIKNCMVPLTLRASAELQTSNSAKALDDVKLMFRLMDSIHNEPILISQLVRMAMLQYTIQPIWEGLAEHKWTDVQLAQIDAELSKLDFLGAYQLAIRGERASGVGIIDDFNSHRQELIEIQFDDPSKVGALFGGPLNQLFPAGWFEQNKISICKTETDYFFRIVDAETDAISLPIQKRASQAIRNSVKKSTPYNWFAHLLIPALENVVRRFAYGQESVDLARIGCALERYHLAHRNYPETLDALAPEFLKTIPHDLIGGQPLKYHRANDGQFVLYSVGWNEKDDDGTVVFTKGKTPDVDIRKGDWVWKYPEN